MNSLLENILKFTLSYEQYKSNNPKDTGGLTIWGIASKYHPVDVAAMNKMTLEEARDKASEIYYNEYWLGGNCDKLSELASQAHFDSCVNTGIGASVRFVQKVVGTVEDGSFGPGTKKAVDEYLTANDDKTFANAIIDLRSNYYKSLNNSTFEKGWLNRVRDLKKYLNLV